MTNHRFCLVLLSFILLALQSPLICSSDTDIPQKRNALSIDMIPAFLGIVDIQYEYRLNSKEAITGRVNVWKPDGNFSYGGEWNPRGFVSYGGGIGYRNLFHEMPIYKELYYYEIFLGIQCLKVDDSFLHNYLNFQDPIANGIAYGPEFSVGLEYKILGCLFDGRIGLGLCFGDFGGVGSGTKSMDSIVPAVWLKGLHGNISARLGFEW